MVALSLTFSLLAIALTSRTVLAGPAPALSSQAGFSYNELFARWDCGGQYCGYSSQLCCPGGTQCYTDTNNQAQCGTVATQAQAGGYWQYYTTTFVRTDLVTITSTMSTFVAGVAPPTATPSCATSLNQTPCGSICCASGQYCYAANQCVAAGNAGSSGFYSSFGPTTATAGPPLRPTSSNTVYITSTRPTITSTVPFQTPVATGANITLVGQELTGGNTGLSGGAIAGIVVGVLAALALLALICFCCCVKGILDGLLAIFGFGRKKRRTEVEEYERRSHHGRTWYGGAAGSAGRPSRVSRVDERKSNEGRNLLGIGAGLAALWAILGLKRKRERRRRDEEKYTEYSYGSTYDYTSASSVSSDDRRTRRSDHISRAPSRR